MAQGGLSKKYSNFYAPKYQIKINTQDISQKYGIAASALTVEQDSSASKFWFIIDDPQARWIDTPLFEPNKTVEVKMGYGAILETFLVQRSKSRKNRLNISE